MSQNILIEVAYAMPETQYLLQEQVAQGSTVAQALEQSKIFAEVPGLVVDKVGIFGKLVNADTVLREGDRIEIYRPLKADPRERRRKKVEQEREAEKQSK